MLTSGAVSRLGAVGSQDVQDAGDLSDPQSGVEAAGRMRSRSWGRSGAWPGRQHWTAVKQAACGVRGGVGGCLLEVSEIGRAGRGRSRCMTAGGQKLE